ncbi:MAG: hypothetical protein Q7V57_09990 [Actinomycetota bacterium]|nr:hypothetical protein [Actinomycetota bacterium]
MARGALAENLTALAALAQKGVVSGAVARERTLPVLPALAGLLPMGAVQRGSIVACQGVAGVSLALSLAAGASQEGAWVGVAGLPGLGVAAAVELGVVPERLVLVVEPAQGPALHFGDERWAEVLAAMIDGFDVVVLGAAAQQVRPATARRLVARLHARGAVALTVGSAVGDAADQGSFAADLTLAAEGVSWYGLGDGHGVARGRRAEVQVGGRRMHRPRRAHLWLPGGEGRVEPVDHPSGDRVVPLRPAG